MKAWLLLAAWIVLGVALAVALWPLVGTTGAVLVPIGWCAGGLLGGIGGAVFTLRSRRQELRLKRTLSAAMGAVMGAVVAGAWPDLAPPPGPALVLPLLVSLAGPVLIAPLCVLVAFWVNERL
jgi:hypothetical protein